MTPPNETAFQQAQDLTEQLYVAAMLAKDDAPLYQLMQNTPKDLTDYLAGDPNSPLANTHQRLKIHTLIGGPMLKMAGITLPDKGPPPRWVSKFYNQLSNLYQRATTPSAREYAEDTDIAVSFQKLITLNPGDLT